jgi:hypothetical protein
MANALILAFISLFFLLLLFEGNMIHSRKIPYSRRFIACFASFERYGQMFA